MMLPKSACSTGTASRPKSYYKQRQIDRIKQDLALSDKKYREFYSVLEQAMKRRGRIDGTYRSISERQTMYQDLSALLLADETIKKRFAATADCMGTPAGQTAFHLLVYKIRTNVRRRKVTKDCTTQHTTDDTERPKPVEDEALSPRAEAGGRPQLTGLEINRMVAIVGEGGRRLPLCRLCEIVVSPDAADYNTVDVERLDFHRLLAIIRVERGWEAGETLGWIDKGEPSPLKTARQWKAVLSEMLLEGLPLNFVIIS